MTATPVINRLVDLYDVDASALADGKVLVRQGSGFVATDVATQAELDARGFAGLADVPSGDGIWTRQAGVLVWKPLGDYAAATDARLSDQRVPVDGSVTTAKVADGAVTAAKVAADVATQAELDAEAAARAAAQTTAIGAAAGLALVLGG